MCNLMLVRRWSGGGGGGGGYWVWRAFGIGLGISGMAGILALSPGSHMFRHVSTSD